MHLLSTMQRAGHDGKSPGNNIPVFTKNVFLISRIKQTDEH